MKRIRLLTLLVVFMVIPSVVYGQNILFKKLKASPDDFVGKDIVMQCRFYGLKSAFLDKTYYSSPSHPGRTYFPSAEYLGFENWAPKDDIFLNFLFIKKGKGEILYELNRWDRITIRGKVTSSATVEAWIEVYEIKKGWK